MPRTKKANQRSHFDSRSLLRLGFILTQETKNRIMEDIREGRSVIIERKSHRASLHQVDINGMSCAVVYDKTRKELVTIYPL